jgi:oxepin-CoA hydrolase/3-oxo-5,6-dehydrosuberyl-CoA semialdehyde dehydrogenase
LPATGVRHQLQHWVGGHWLACDEGAPVASTVLDVEVASLPASIAPIEEVVHAARLQGRNALRRLNFARRGQMLRALAKHLLEQKEILYAWSFHTGATRKDSWIDIEGASPR